MTTLDDTTGIAFAGAAPECPTEQVRRALRAGGVACIDADETIRDYAADLLPLVGMGVRHGLGNATRLTLGGYGRKAADAWAALRRAESTLREAGVVREWREGLVARRDRGVYRAQADAVLTITPMARGA